MAARDSLTLVTALFDLARREPEADRRTVGDYFETADFVLGLDQDLVAFCDPELAGELTRRREDAGLGPRTRVVPIALEELESYGRLEAVRGARPIRNGDPDKDTPLYTVLGWAKFELLCRAAELDPFAGTHLAWIDLALAARPHPDDSVFATPPSRVRLLRMRGFDARDVADPGEFYSYRRGHIAGGYIAGPRSLILELGQLVLARAGDAVAHGWAALEEQLLVVLAIERPDLFEFAHGDYDAMLLNQLSLRGSAPNLHFQLRDARERGDGAHAIALTAEVADALRTGVLESDPAVLAQILDEGFIAAWYHGDPGHRLARELAERLYDLIAREAAARDVFLREEVRMRGNLALLEARA